MTDPNPYARSAATIGVSTLVMFGLMYLNTYEVDHIVFSETRAYITIVMGPSMAIVMLGFMRHNLKNRGADLAILVGSGLVFAAAL